MWSASHFSQLLVFGLTLQYLQWPFCHTSWSHPPEQLNLKTKFDDGANQTTYLWRSIGHTLWNSTTHICIKDGLTWKKCAFDLIILELKEKWTWKQLETPGNSWWQQTVSEWKWQRREKTNSGYFITHVLYLFFWSFGTNSKAWRRQSRASSLSFMCCYQHCCLQKQHRKEKVTMKSCSLCTVCFLKGKM